MSEPLRLACFISGGGRTLLNIADHIDQGRLNASIELVIASRADVAGVAKSRARGLNTLVVARRDYPDEDAMHDAISKQLHERGIELICLCGYLRPVRIDEAFRWRIINIHPALLPLHGGKGMYGDNVHRAVLSSGAKESGCTVHLVDEHYDQGPIILQRRVPVLAHDTPATLAARVFEQECIAYPQAIELFAENRVHVLDGNVQISPPARTASVGLALPPQRARIHIGGFREAREFLHSIALDSISKFRWHPFNPGLNSTWRARKELRSPIRERIKDACTWKGLHCRGGFVRAVGR